MYRHFFGFADRPFELTPNPEYLLLTSIHREALAMLQYGVSSQKGLVVLTGEAGTGKTTLLRTLEVDTAASLFVSITNPRLDRQEFVETIVRRFGLTESAARSKPLMLEELQQLLVRMMEDDRRCVLIVDEAHGLSDELLEEVRLLANLETDTTKMLTIVLAGQPELSDSLNAPHHWQLKQRVALRCSLRTLSPEETVSYIATRIRRAGGQPAAVFTREAVQACHVHSRGIPRLVSVICDNALIAAYAAAEKPVKAARVLEVCAELDLLDGSKAPSATIGVAPHVVTEAAEAAPAIPPEASAENPVGRTLFGHFSETRRASLLR